jgi:glycosyltransferase involved in cell wall biosynthesis
VVVPTCNRAAVLREAVESLLCQRYPADRYELVVVDNGSRDDTPLVMRSLLGAGGGPVVRYLALPVADANTARNRGVEAARGDPICLVDDDVLVPPDWLAEMVATAERHPEAACLGGPVRTLPGARLYRCPRHPTAGTTLDEGPDEREVSEVWGPNMAVRRAALELAGPFREGLPWQQEWEWQQRLLDAGGRIVYSPGAWLWHLRTRPRGLRESFLRGVRIGRRRSASPVNRSVRQVGGALAHTAAARCRYGTIESARHLGVLCGVLSERLHAQRAA